MIFGHMIIFGLQQFQFASLKYLWLVFLLPVLVLVYVYGFLRRGQALKKFAELGALRFISASVSRERRILKAAMLLFAVLLLIVTLMRPGFQALR